jgi:hypothetical protein
MTQKIETKTGNPVNVNEQPPAAQLTTNDTTKHNACVSTGWGAIAARAGQKILFLFCSWFLQKKKEDFLRLTKCTLVSIGNQTCNFAIMFGVLEMIDCPEFDFENVPRCSKR